jgi:hypothetical protein
MKEIQTCVYYLDYHPVIFSQSWKNSEGTVFMSYYYRIKFSEIKKHNLKLNEENNRVGGNKRILD